MKLYFSRSNGEEVFIKDCSNRKEIFEEVNNYLANYNYKAPYIRMWRTDEDKEKVTLDFGSWSEFFTVEDKEYLMEI